MPSEIATPIVGHDLLLQGLWASIQKKTVPHAFLFEGPRGVGKGTVARQMASYLAASNAKDQGSVPSSWPEMVAFMERHHPETFRYMENANHPTIRLMTAASGGATKSISVEDVRGLKEFVSGRTDGYKIVIIDGAEDMTVQAANALLKILEEPADRVVFFLVCHVTGGLLDTIKSRCQVRTFHRLTEENFNILFPQEDTGSVLYTMAEGAPGVAHELLGLGGITLYQNFLDALHDVLSPTGTFISARNLGKSIAKQAPDQFVMVVGLLWRRFFGGWLQLAFRHQAIHEKYDNAVLPEEVEFYEKYQHTLAAKPMVDVYQRITQHFANQVELNLDAQQIFLNTFVDLRSISQ